MAATKEKTDPQSSNNYLNSLSKEERILHIAAGASALHEKFSDVIEDVIETLPDVDNLDHIRISLPISWVGGAVEVLGEMLALLEEKNIVSKLAVDEFVNQKISEMQAKSMAEGKPEGWCENCQMVHEHEGASAPQATLEKVAKAIVSMMAAAEAARATINEDLTVPPGVTKH